MAAGRTVDTARKDLRDVSVELAKVNDRREVLYRLRDDLFVELREGFDKPLTQREIASDAGCKEVAVVAALGKIGRLRGRKVL